VKLAQEARRLLTADYQASLTIDQLCRRLGTHAFTLKNAFRHTFGTSIGKYKKAAFMEYAKQLVLDTDKGLDEISIKLGYKNYSNFSTAFANYFGDTPGRVRKGGRG
jgi:two-component system response regulator YesN